MPNYCDCDIEIQGPKEAIEHIRATCTRPDGFDLSALHPCPEELAALCTGFRTMPDGSVATVWKNTPEGSVAVDTAPLIEKYGSGDWHAWSVKNWGTKWINSFAECDVDRSVHDYEEEGLAYLAGSFQTAWSPPIPFLKKVAKDFPDCVFALRYFEQGMTFQGYMRIRGEAVEVNEQYAYHGSRGG